MTSSTTEIFNKDSLHYLIEEGYDKDSWHGPCLKASLKGVGTRQAIWRPGIDRKNIAEIVLHCAYWKNQVRKKIERSRKNDFPFRGKNWFPVAERCTAADWRRYRSVLDKEHKLLCKVIEKTPVAKLLASRQKSQQPVSFLVGISMHDVYHAGQIRSLRSQMTR